MEIYEFVRLPAGVVQGCVFTEQGKKRCRSCVFQTCIFTLFPRTPMHHCNVSQHGGETRLVQT